MNEMVDIPTKAIHTVAHFSDCKNYRYNLIRTFANGEGIINFIMLNPSTANEEFNDPTVARCEQRALDYGFKQMIVTNIFAFRATDPKEMQQADDPLGMLNDFTIIQEAKKSHKVICAWGEIGKFMHRSDRIRQLLRMNHIDVHALKINKSGEPAHPLYLSFKLEPTVYHLMNTDSVAQKVDS